jgi:hypothetical protein
LYDDECREGIKGVSVNIPYVFQLLRAYEGEWDDGQRDKATIENGGD